jgi:hypothetical protein
MCVNLTVKIGSHPNQSRDATQGHKGWLQVSQLSTLFQQAIYGLTVLKYLHTSANDPLGFAFQTATI